MKIQSVCSLDQAQSLDRAIKEAGLEWPEIEWGWYYSPYEVEWDGGYPGLKHVKEPVLVSASEMDHINDLHSGLYDDDPEDWPEPVFLPAPTGMDLAAMIPEAAWSFSCHEITVEKLLKALLDELAVRGDPLRKHRFKAHWATLK